MKQILFALKVVFLSYTPARSFIESMMRYDFKIGDAKTNMMSLCFSNLAAWPLLVFLFIIGLDPFKSSWSLVNLLTYENPLVLLLLDGHLPNMILFFSLFYFLEWFIRNEYILISIIFYFLGRSELHIQLATASVVAVYLSRVTYLWRLSVNAESETKKIWKTISILQLAAWIFIALTAISALDYIQINHFFSSSGDLSRFNFLFIVILLYHGFSHLFLSLWGHFYIQKKIEPTALPIYYSTMKWISKFRIGRDLREQLRVNINQQLAKHLENEKLFSELKSQNPALAKFSVEAVLKKELIYLKEAANKI